MAVHVVESALVDTPTAVGWLRPVILLPIAALANLTPSQVEAILAHELIHIRRHDYLVNLAQTWPRPFVLSSGRVVGLGTDPCGARALL